MPRPAYRTRGLIKKHVKTPGGHVVIHYVKRKPSSHRCVVCGKIIGGTSSLRPSRQRRVPRTKKRPNRIYGGVLCPNCLARFLKSISR